MNQARPLHFPASSDFQQHLAGDRAERTRAAVIVTLQLRSVTLQLRSVILPMLSVTLHPLIVTLPMMKL